MVGVFIASMLQGVRCAVFAKGAHDEAGEELSTHGQYPSGAALSAGAAPHAPLHAQHVRTFCAGRCSHCLHGWLAGDQPLRMQAAWRQGALALSLTGDEVGRAHVMVCMGHDGGPLP